MQTNSLSKKFSGFSQKRFQFRFRKTISLLATFFFTMTTLLGDNLLWAQSAYLNAGNEVTGKGFSLTQVPAELGRVREVYQPQNAAGPFILHIQDAHANKDAQQNIAAILDWVQNHRSIVVGLEGAVSEIHPEYLELFPDYQEANDAVVRDLVEKGELNGTELFAWNQRNAKDEPAFKVIGAEDADLYAENLLNYRTLVYAQNEIESLLQPYRKNLEIAKSRILSPELRSFIRERERRKYGNYASDASSPQLSAYLTYLAQTVRKELQIDLENSFEQIRFPNLYRILIMAQIQKNLDLRKAAREKQKALDALTAAAGSDADRETVETLAALVKGMPAREIVEKAWDFAVRSRIDLTHYKNYLLELGSLILNSEIEAEALFAEVDLLESALIQSWIRNEDEAALVQILDDFDLTAKLLSLKWTTTDLAAFESRRDEVLESAFNGRLEALAAKTGDASSIQKIERQPELEGYVSRALGFYEGAEARDRALLEKTIAAAGPGDVAVLVTGGFHTEGLTALMREGGSAYAVVQPNILHNDMGKTYERALREENADVSAYFQQQPLTKQESIFFKALVETAAPALFEKHGVSHEEIGAKVAEVLNTHPVLSQRLSARAMKADKRSRVDFRVNGVGNEAVAIAALLQAAEAFNRAYQQLERAEADEAVVASSALQGRLIFQETRGVQVIAVPGIPADFDVQRNEQRLEQNEQMARLVQDILAEVQADPELDFDWQEKLTPREFDLLAKVFSDVKPLVRPKSTVVAPGQETDNEAETLRKAAELVEQSALARLVRDGVKAIQEHGVPDVDTDVVLNAGEINLLLDIFSDKSNPKTDTRSEQRTFDNWEDYYRAVHWSQPVPTGEAAELVKAVFENHREFVTDFVNKYMQLLLSTFNTNQDLYAHVTERARNTNTEQFSAYIESFSEFILAVRRARRTPIVSVTGLTVPNLLDLYAVAVAIEVEGAAYDVTVSGPDQVVDVVRRSERAPVIALNPAQEALLAKAAEVFSLEPYNVEYLRQMWLQYLFPDSSKQLRIAVAGDAQPGNYTLASQLSEDDRERVLGAFEYTKIKGNAAYALAAKSAQINIYALDGGLGESLGRKEFKQVLVDRGLLQETDVERDDDGVIKLGAKGTDLGFVITLNGKEVFVSIAEAKLLQMITLKNSGKFAGFTLTPLVNKDSLPSYEKLLDREYLFDRIDDDVETNRTYREVIEGTDGIDILPPHLQQDIPGINVKTGDVATDPLAISQPGGHAQLGFYFFAYPERWESPNDNAQILFFANGDNLNLSAADEFIVGLLLQSRLPIVKLTTPATRIDTKGGKDGVVSRELSNGVTVQVPQQMEIADAKAQKQEEIFTLAGQPEGAVVFGEQSVGNQPFNTNGIKVFENVLYPLLADLKAALGEADYFRLVIAPTLIQKGAKNGKDGQSYQPVDAAIGTVIHNLNEFVMTNEREDVKSVLDEHGIQPDDNGIYRLLYFVNVPRDKFTPDKKPLDAWLQQSSDYYIFNTEFFKLDENGEVNPPELDIRGDHYSDVQRLIHALGYGRVTRLDSLLLEGPSLLPDATFIGTVEIVNKGTEEVDLRSARYRDQLTAAGIYTDGDLRFENVALLFDENGDLTVRNEQRTEYTNLQDLSGPGVSQFLRNRFVDEKRLYESEVQVFTDPGQGPVVIENAAFIADPAPFSVLDERLANVGEVKQILVRPAVKRYEGEDDDEELRSEQRAVQLPVGPLAEDGVVSRLNFRRLLRSLNVDAFRTQAVTVDAPVEDEIEILLPEIDGVLTEVKISRAREGAELDIDVEEVSDARRRIKLRLFSQGGSLQAFNEDGEIWNLDDVDLNVDLGDLTSVRIILDEEGVAPQLVLIFDVDKQFQLPLNNLITEAFRQNDFQLRGFATIRGQRSEQRDQDFYTKGLNVSGPTVSLFLQGKISERELKLSEVFVYTDATQGPIVLENTVFKDATDPFGVFAQRLKDVGEVERILVRPAVIRFHGDDVDQVRSEQRLSVRARIAAFGAWAEAEQVLRKFGGDEAILREKLYGIVENRVAASIDVRKFLLTDFPRIANAVLNQNQKNLQGIRKAAEDLDEILSLYTHLVAVGKENSLDEQQVVDLLTATPTLNAFVDKLIRGKIDDYQKGVAFWNPEFRSKVGSDLTDADFISKKVEEGVSILKNQGFFEVRFDLENISVTYNAPVYVSKEETYEVEEYNEAAYQSAMEAWGAGSYDDVYEAYKDMPYDTGVMPRDPGPQPDPLDYVIKSQKTRQIQVVSHYEQKTVTADIAVSFDVIQVRSEQRVLDVALGVKPGDIRFLLDQLENQARLLSGVTVTQASENVIRLIFDAIDGVATTVEIARRDDGDRLHVAVSETAGERYRDIDMHLGYKDSVLEVFSDTGSLIHLTRDHRTNYLNVDFEDLTDIRLSAVDGVARLELAFQVVKSKLPLSNRNVEAFRANGFALNRFATVSDRSEMRDLLRPLTADDLTPTQTAARLAVDLVQGTQPVSLADAGREVTENATAGVYAKAEDLAVRLNISVDAALALLINEVLEPGVANETAFAAALEAMRTEFGPQFVEDFLSRTGDPSRLVFHDVTNASLENESALTLFAFTLMAQSQNRVYVISSPDDDEDKELTAEQVEDILEKLKREVSRLGGNAGVLKDRLVLKTAAFGQFDAVRKDILKEATGGQYADYEPVVVARERSFLESFGFVPGLGRVDRKDIEPLESHFLLNAVSLGQDVVDMLMQLEQQGYSRESISGRIGRFVAALRKISASA